MKSLIKFKLHRVILGEIHTPLTDGMLEILAGGGGGEVQRPWKSRQEWVQPKNCSWGVFLTIVLGNFKELFAIIRVQHFEIPVPSRLLGLQRFESVHLRSVMNKGRMRHAY